MRRVEGRRDAAWSDVGGAAADRTSGAAEITLRAAEALGALPATDLEEAVRALVAGHPSMAPLWRLGTVVLEAEDHRDAAVRFAHSVLSEREGVARQAAATLDAPRVVTHSYSSTVVAAVAAAGPQAVCARSDPGGEGHETARRLREAGADAAVVKDHVALAAAASGIPVVTGADAVGSGGAVNKVGTRSLVRASRSGGGTSVILAGTSKLLAVDLPAPHPFERTPLDAVDVVVTEEGALRPDEALEAAGHFPVHPALAAVLRELG
jgi:translation initiation factor 2B subunit (eIF-2B alpha/beta/delta family)